MADSTYTVPAICGNCGYMCSVRIPTGKPADLGFTTCPKCKLKRFERNWTREKSRTQTPPVSMADLFDRFFNGTRIT